MDFQFRVTDGRTFKYNFSPDTTIEMVKKKICEQNDFDILKLKLIHRCQLLTDDTKIQDIKITPAEFIIVQPLSYIPNTINSPIGKLPELKPEPLSPSEIAESLKNLDPDVQLYKSEIKTLLEMGFSLQVSIRALCNTNFDVIAAAESLANDCYDNEFAHDFRRNEREFQKENLAAPFYDPPHPLNSPPILPFGVHPEFLNNQDGPTLGPPLGIQPGTFPQFPPQPNLLPQFNNPGYPPPPPQLIPQQPNNLGSANPYFNNQMLTQDQQIELEQLTHEYSHLPIDVIMQFYIASGNNINKTKEMLDSK